jgi:hypothetical protein
LIVLALAACSRRSELFDRPDASVGGPSSLDASIPEVEDSGIDDPSLPACGERPTGNCQGANDFPCSFEPWMYEVAVQCQTETGCHADDWVEVRTGDDGCVSAIHMTVPEPDYIACLVETFGHFSCPCEATGAAYFLGLGNDGCAEPCDTGEFPCPAGESCIAGTCEPDG